ncbi:MAG TPA: carboxylating nicotinate-nucleotide diphosphorylase, partial [bacterium]|nr:carboxylating nicotinate-nucleotide diphosphorylase [bacterium]
MNELNHLLLRRAVESALAEDVGPGDLTTISTVSPQQRGRGIFVAKQPGILCGIPAMTEVFKTLDRDLDVSPIRRDGERLEPGDALAEVKGRARSILTGERLALNFLQRLSGIATLTAKMAAAVGGTGARIVDTRKTTPGLRFLEKYAVRTGGGHNHRFSLADAVLIKDNHIVAAGGIGEAVKKAREIIPHTMTVEVEAETE